MPKKSSVLLACLPLGLVLACPLPDGDDPPGAPDPIGDELMSMRSVFGLESCQQSYLYQDGRALQLQCFRLDGTFSWENRGTLSTEGGASLDAELATADLDNTAPGDHNGLCNGSDSGAATMTAWVGGRSISYAPVCPTEGVEALNELLLALFGDIGDCVELELLEAVELGCRAY